MQENVEFKLTENIISEASNILSQAAPSSDYENDLSVLNEIISELSGFVNHEDLDLVIERHSYIGVQLSYLLFKYSKMLGSSLREFENWMSQVKVEKINSLDSDASTYLKKNKSTTALMDLVKDDPLYEEYEETSEMLKEFVDFLKNLFRLYQARKDMIIQASTRDKQDLRSVIND